MTVYRLTERGSAEIDLTPGQAGTFRELGLKVNPVRSGRWRVEPHLLVGAVRVGDVELRIRPKLNPKRLLFLLGFSRREIRWQEEDVGAEPHEGLVPVIATLFVRAAVRALAGGPPRGFRRLEATLSTVRGRWRVGDQIRRRYGTAPPVEVSYETYTTDVPETRLLIAAARRLLELPDVPDDTRCDLRRLLRRLPPDAPNPSSGRESWSRTRANARFHAVLDLAELIVADHSYELGDGRIRPDGFLVNMERLFEDFVFSALEGELRPYGGVLRQKRGPRHHLDADDRARIELDVGWYMPSAGEERVVAIADAKYMDDWHAAELYQQTAYCTALGLPRSHIVYAAGDRPRTVYRVRNTDIEIVRHTLDLGQDIEGLRGQIAAIATELRQDAATVTADGK